MSAAREAATAETKLEMTPMIDVTFLLLIFFLCTIKFKILEGKIPAFLPKDVGVNATPIDKELEKIEIHIVRTASDIETFDEYGNSTKWEWSEKQIQIKIGPKVCSGLREFHDLVKKAHESNTEAKATIYPHKGTLYIDAVKVVNECLRANFTAITFAGAPRDA
jgi:biopolymer transport protein ExbD